jgi:hypothetical protein
VAKSVGICVKVGEGVDEGEAVGAAGWVVAAIEPVREDLHRRALDECVRLAELRIADERHEAAVGALERAIELDQICEDAYRLQVRLAELDLDPEPATEMLVRQALSSHAPASRASGRR